MVPVHTTQICVLVVEDAPEFQQLVGATFKADRFDVVIVGSGTEALHSVDERRPDVVILDLGLPDMDGVELCREIRKRTQCQGGAPCWVLMLTGRDEEMDHVMGLAAGADDYVTKPFSLPVLRARVEALLRRSNQMEGLPAGSGAAEVSRPADQPVRQVGNVRVDPTSREVTVGAAAVRLTRKEFDLLQTLCTRPSRVLTRLELVHAVWGSDWFGDDHVVDVHIGNLRRKLRDAAASAVVETVRGIGFKLSPPQN